MRDIMTIIATVCAVAGLVLACGSCIFDHETSWISGFVTGTLATAAITLASAAALALLVW